MCGRPWTDAELQFLREHYPEHTATWCAKKLGRGRSSVSLKVKSWFVVAENRLVKEKLEDPDLGPATPPLENHCVDCDRVSPTRRCPECQKKHLAGYHGECWGPTYDEAYGVAL